jgi:hypothetical protein
MKFFSSLLLIFITSFSFTQLSISTEYRQDGIWDEAKEEWKINYKADDFTLFEFDVELSKFKHTTSTITSWYEILDWDYNEDDVKYTMKVKSDAGNEYEMIIDGINNCVAFFYWKNNLYHLVRHTIKNSSYKE